MTQVITEPQPQGTYEPVGVPAVSPTHHPGMTQGIFGLLCAVVSLLFFPPLFGIGGIFLGVSALKKGERALGITTIVLSALFMIIGMAFGAYVKLHPEFFKVNTMSGAVIQSLLE